MERKVTIISSRTRSQHVINSKATTLGELKEEARRAGIDFENMSWFEGHLRAELLEDSSPLPTDIPWRGTVTNDLTFMLSNSEKHIKSGNPARTELYDKIKSSDLAGRCKELYGKNFTQCTNEQLNELITAYARPKYSCTEKDIMEIDKDVVGDKEEAFTNKKEVFKEDGLVSVKKAVMELVEELYYDDTISSSCYDKVLGLLANKPSEKGSKVLSQEEIDEMFGFINK